MNSNSNISNTQESKEALFSISYAKMSDLIKQYSLYKSVESKISDTSDGTHNPRFNIFSSHKNL